ncbi:MAG: hypothetical protein EAZ09_07770 [Oscillatoriales cyanobacterium]|nr:MAG: hypothetical protein EAZ18_01990 [Oscillatoriales cyanobacterium]TAH23255.1 MAG: hypothetical protein EAZ09_07770 [Oscillatoriales cyanobacterium]
MKKFQLLAGIASTVAIAGTIALSDTAFASPCPYSKSGAAQSGSGTTLVGSGGESQMNAACKSYKLFALGFLGLAGVLGGGAAYMSYRAGKRAIAACAAMSDNFEVFEESIADGYIDEYLEVPSMTDRQHPEAPGGELDLASSSAIESAESAIVQ